MSAVCSDITEKKWYTAHAQPKQTADVHRHPFDLWKAIQRAYRSKTEFIISFIDEEDTSLFIHTIYEHVSDTVQSFSFLLVKFAVG